MRLHWGHEIICFQRRTSIHSWGGTFMKQPMQVSLLIRATA
jgi:hypothetical protein